MRNYKKEYENYHSRPEQKIRRAARNAARKRFSNADPTLDVHHKDNDPLNNDLNNLSLVTQHYNRKEPRLREKKLKDLKSKLTAALRQTEGTLPAGFNNPMRLRTIGRDLEKFAKTDRGGQPIDRDADKDKKDMIKVAAMLKKGDKSTALKYAKKLDNHRRLKHFGISLTPQQYILDLLGENVQEGLSDPQALAKEIEWGVSSKNVDSQALSTKQKKQMKDIVKLMQRSKAPNWVSKFTQVYFSSDKLVQQRLKSAAKRGGMSPELMKKLFKEGLAVLPKGGFRNQFEPEITAWEKKLGKKIQKKLSPEMKKDLMKFLKQKYGSAARHFKIPDQLEDMGSTTGAHIAGTGDDNTVHTRRKKKKKVERRISLIKGMTRKR